MKLFTFLLMLFVCLFLDSCSDQKPTTKLPYLGNPKLVSGDTLYPKIPTFTFIKQDSTEISNSYFKNKIYVADFIFLSCPTICPKMTSEMQKVYKKFENNESVYFLSHTIDPEKDSVSVLKNYAKSLGIDTKKWSFVTGEKETIFSIAENGYFSTAYSDSTAPGGFAHSGGLLLIDKERHIRGVYDGTNSKETKRLIQDIKKLLKEQF